MIKILVFLILSILVYGYGFMSTKLMNNYVSKIYRGKSFNLVQHMMNPLKKITDKSSMNASILDTVISPSKYNYKDSFLVRRNQ